MNRWVPMLAGLLLAGVALAQSGTGIALSGASMGAIGWRAVKIGGGGYITGIDISPDGETRCVRTDTYGAYCRNESDTAWQQVVTDASMPAARVIAGNGAGAWELRVAPSEPARLYMGWDGYVFRSNDTGATWTQTAFTQVTMDANEGAGIRLAGQKMAVDPQNADVVLVGTPEDGLWRTEDGGTTWAQIASVPDTGRIAAIAFATGEAADGRTDRVWLGSLATGGLGGAYLSTDEGDTFALVSGGPNGESSGVWHGAAEGTSYFITTGAFGGPNVLWRNVTGVWTNITASGTSPQHFALDSGSDRIVAASESTSMRISTDNGATWSSAFTSRTLVCPNAPWLCTASAAASVGVASSAVMFDPVVADRVWITGGTTPWYTSAASVAPDYTLTEHVVGIEQLVANTVIVPPNGNDIPITASWDFGVRRITDPETYPSGWAITPNQFGAAWHADWASSDPNFIVAFLCWAGPSQTSTSTDGGATWTLIPTMPVGSDCDDTWGYGGTGAVASPTNFIWVSSSAKAPYRTTDGGATWSKLVLPGVPDDATEAGWQGFHYAGFLNRHNVAADRVNIGTFYAAHYTHGIFRSTDAGETWTLMNGPLGNLFWNAKLTAVPGHAGHLFLTAGQAGALDDPPPAAQPFYRSTDGGDTWTEVAGLEEVFAFGFGKVVNGYPTILAIAWLNDEYGVWRSIDNASSWSRVGPEFALGSFDQASTIDGDKFGDRVFIGFRGSGYAYF